MHFAIARHPKPHIKKNLTDISMEIPACIASSLKYAMNNSYTLLYLYLFLLCYIDNKLRTNRPFAFYSVTE